MTPTLPLSQSPSLPPSPLCRHTLADIRAWLHASHLNHLRPTCSLLPLTIAAHPEGLARSRFSEVEIERCRKRAWGKHVVLNRQRVFPTGGLYSALGLHGPAECASIGRVLRELVKQGWKNSDLALLIHASMDGGVRRHELYNLPFTTDVRNHQTLIADTIARGLLLIEPRYNHQISRVQRYLCLTAAGEKLLLGQWGKAMTKAEGGMTNEAMEGRKAA